MGTWGEINIWGFGGNFVRVMNVGKSVNWRKMPRGPDTQPDMHCRSMRREDWGYIWPFLEKLPRSRTPGKPFPDLLVNLSKVDWAEENDHVEVIKVFSNFLLAAAQFTSQKSIWELNCRRSPATHICWFSWLLGRFVPTKSSVGMQARSISHLSLARSVS